MKFISILTAVILLAAQTWAEPSSVNMPFIFHDRCVNGEKQLIFPKGLEGTTFYYNRDCTVAFIVPPPTGEIRFSKPALFENMKLCPAVSSNLELVKMLQENILSLGEEVKGLKGAALAEKVLEIKSLQDLQQTLVKEYVGTPGMKVKVNVFGSLTEDYMNKIRAANVHTMKQGNFRIERAPLQKSYLTFNAINASNTYNENPVLESNVIGILSRADEEQKDKTSITFNGSASGYLTLSLIGACPLMKGDYSDLASLKLDTLSAESHFVVTNTMLVPVISAFGYTAEVQSERMTEALFDKYGHNGTFTAQDFTNFMLHGSASEIIQIRSWTLSSLTGQKETQYASFTNIEEQNKIKEHIVQMYLEQLSELDLVKQIKAIDTPKAGSESQYAGIERQCSSKSSWFGLSKSTSCRDVPYYIQVSRDGMLQQKAVIDKKFSVNFAQSVEVLHPEVSTFTSIFSVKADQ